MDIFHLTLDKILFMEQLQFSLVLVADAHSFGHAVALSITLAWLALANEKVAVCAGMLQLANIMRIAFRELDDLALVTASDRPRAAPCFPCHTTHICKHLTL